MKGSPNTEETSGCQVLPPAFRVARYRFRLAFERPWTADGWAGNALRGAFGWALKRGCCIVAQTDCRQCLLRRQCAYAYLFETAPPTGSDRLRKLTDIPRPFVFEPIEAQADDETTLEFGLVLVGRAIDYLPHFVFTFQELGRRGLGREHVPFVVESLVAEARNGAERCVYTAADGELSDVAAGVTGTDLSCPDHWGTKAPRHLTVRFLTPTRLRFEGEALPEVEFHHLIRALLRRLSALCYFHCDTELDVDFRGLIERAESVRTTAARLEWCPQVRYSRRQEREVKISGFVGETHFEGELAPFVPLLAAGEWTHVGKGCVMGLGRFRVQALA
ncbi:MAG: CRISPR system precrRNA processing endoribonuclease RAMP protein Cas6 [Armatimonadetes bacterium]|nr:CRISPR system precrRNA processing endoribonuclease RAMP protein Cas6 [Armatimonadota bacterium]